MSDRWRALVAILLMAAVVAGARQLLRSARPELKVLRLPGLDR